MWRRISCRTPSLHRRCRLAGEECVQHYLVPAQHTLTSNLDFPHHLSPSSPVRSPLLPPLPSAIEATVAATPSTTGSLPDAAFRCAGSWPQPAPYRAPSIQRSSQFSSNLGHNRSQLIVYLFIGPGCGIVAITGSCTDHWDRWRGHRKWAFLLRPLIPSQNRCGRGRDGRDEGLSPWTTDYDQISSEFASPWVTAVCPDHCRPKTCFSHSVFNRWDRQ